MYSEHLIAAVLAQVDGAFTTGARLDAVLGRVVVTVGRVLGPMIGTHPSDGSVIWFASTYGKPARLGTRGAVHLLRDGTTALHLGKTRGAIETAGDRLVVVRRPASNRYVAAWYLPNTSYGGLI